MCVCVCADLQRGLPDCRQCSYSHSVPVWSQNQPEHCRRERSRSQRSLQNSEGQRGHVHPEVGQRRRWDKHTQNIASQTCSPPPSHLSSYIKSTSSSCTRAGQMATEQFLQNVHGKYEWDHHSCTGCCRNKSEYLFGKHWKLLLESTPDVDNAGCLHTLAVIEATNWIFFFTFSWEAGPAVPHLTKEKPSTWFYSWALCHELSVLAVSGATGELRAAAAACGRKSHCRMMCCTRKHLDSYRVPLLSTDINIS